MRKPIAALSTLALMLGLGGVALADHSKPQQGVVASVDPQKRTVTFEDGTTFTAGEGVEVLGLAPGERVTFYYHDWGSGKVVVSYELGWHGPSQATSSQ
jgi:hypothetical protein